MIRWVDSEAGRLHPQEMALLALLDRMTSVEQLVTLQGDTQLQTIRETDRKNEALTSVVVAQARRIADLSDRLLAQRESILALEDQLRRLEMTVRTLP